MVERNEGIRRIMFIISVLFVIGWLLYAGVQSKGFSNVPLKGWIVLISGSLIAYLVPQWLAKIVYWVVDGFKKN